MRKLLLTTAAVLMLSTAANAQTLYQVSPGVSDGVLNIRRGPSASFTLLGVIPAGQNVMVTRCVPPQDTFSKADWCEVQYQNFHGWASTSGMYPVPVVAASPVAAPVAPRAPIAPAVQVAPRVFSFDLVCTPAIVVATRSDPNPVAYIRIRGTGVPGSLQSISVVQVLANGNSYERMDQYNINTKLYSDGDADTYGWSGNWNKDINYEMVGMLGADSYTERQTKRGVVQFIQNTPCARTTTR